MKKSLLTFLNILLFSTAIYATAWKKANGPYGGIVTSFAQSDKYFIAGCNWNVSGVYVSEDFGDNWAKVTKTDKPSYQIPDVSVNAIVKGESEDVFYVACDGEGVYKLFKNNGVWELKNIGFRAQMKSALSIVYQEGNLFVCFWEDGIYKSSNEGSSWTKVVNGLGSQNVHQLALKGDSIFAATDQGIFISSSSGQNWASFNNELNGKYFSKIFISENYICAFEVGEGTYIFTMDGNVFSKNIRSDHITPVIPIGIVDGKIYGGHTINGLYYAELPSAEWKKSTSEFDYLWPLTITKLNGDIFLGLNGFGIFKSFDNGQNWEPSCTGMRAFRFTSIETIGNTIFASTDVNGVFKSIDYGYTWQRINNGLGYDFKVEDMLIKDSIMYLASSSIYISKDKGDNWKLSKEGYARRLAKNSKSVYAGFLMGGVSFTNDHGETWENSGFSDHDKWLNSIDVLDSVVLIGTSEGGPYYSTDYGKTWAQINKGISNMSVNSVLIKGKRFFITAFSTDGYGSGVYRTSDYGNKWEKKNNGISSVPIDLKLVGNIVYGLAPYSIMFTVDNGENWISRSGLTDYTSMRRATNEEPQIQAVAHNNEYVFAGTDFGFYYKEISEVFDKEALVGIEELPDKATIQVQNFPNPVNGHTKISYSVHKYEKNLSIVIYDRQGKIISSINEKDKDIGTHTIDLDVSLLPPGIYYYSIYSNDGKASNKMIIL